MSQREVRSETDPYEIRPYADGDLEGFLDLYEDVMGARKSETWFDWKYRENPYVDHVPMIVATADDEIVGARPLFALPLLVDGRREIALQPGDTMVHPDHRRRGIFTRMTERAIERYHDEHPCFFNFPNEKSRGGYLKMGWNIVAEWPSYYRIEHPEALADWLDGPLTRPLGSVAASVLRTGTAAGSRVASARDVDIHRPTAPAATLSALYREAIPDGIHVPRDEPFYEWRFTNPDWEYRAYVAERDGSPTAALVAGTSTTGGPLVTKLTEALPLDESSPRAMRSLLERVVQDHPATDLFVAPATGVPETALSATGFRSDRRFPLSRLTEPHVQVVYPLGRGSDMLHEAARWTLTFVEHDTC